MAENYFVDDGLIIQGRGNCLAQLQVVKGELLVTEKKATLTRRGAFDERGAGGSGSKVRQFPCNLTYDIALHSRRRLTTPATATTVEV